MSNIGQMADYLEMLKNITIFACIQKQQRLQLYKLSMPIVFYQKIMHGYKLTSTMTLKIQRH
jgi:hypothetical protein